MARQKQQVARKDYPDQGIKKGDTYWFASVKTGRGGITIRSLTRIPESRLTTSTFKSAWFSVQEEWESSDKMADDIRTASEALAGLEEETRGSFGNMPERLQEGETGQMLNARAEACENAVSELDRLADELEGLDDLPDEPVEPLDDLENDEARETYDNDMEMWQQVKDEGEADKDRIRDEVDALIGDMPE